jgi:chemotaxis protein MotB
VSDTDHAQIVIVRRHADHEEGHHGGAWKIAFADFMTALMALFLVLWLISSTNEDTKVSLARYFNPVKLVDMSPVRKGMADPSKADGSKDDTKKDDESKKEDEKKPAKAAKAAAEGAKAEAASDSHEKPPKAAPPKPPKPEGSSGIGGPVDATREAALFRDPYAVLAGIAAADKAQQSAAQNVDALGFSGRLPDDRDAFDDPFASDAQAARPASPANDAAAPANAAPAVESATIAQADAKPGAKQTTGAALDQVGEATKLQTDIAKALPKSTPSRPEPQVEVKATKEGLLISLTDDALFSMFSVGSAEPQGQTVEAMAKIATLLKSRTGSVVIRGFTDSRPYKSPVYDNWRLSSSRAHMAQYMLIRGGLDEKRIEAVEGYSDRRPKIKADPMAPQNRRIEILVRPEAAP